MTLHTWNKADTNLASFRLCLASCRPGDALLLIEDGVYAATCPTLAAFAEPAELRLFALAGDLAARGISARIPAFLTPVDYGEFVALSVQHARVVSWI